MRPCSIQASLNHSINIPSRKPCQTGEKASSRWSTERPSKLLKVTQQSSSKLDPAPNLQMSSLMPCPLDHESFNEATSAGLQAGPPPGAGDLPGIPISHTAEALPSMAGHRDQA